MRSSAAFFCLNEALTVLESEVMVGEEAPPSRSPLSLLGARGPRDPEPSSFLLGSTDLNGRPQHPQLLSSQL